MWVIYEHRLVIKQLKLLPIELLKRYEKWKDIIFISGPEGLHDIKGFHDEALLGKWNGYRSSRLNSQYRIVYRIDRDKILVQVINITPHAGGNNMSQFQKAKKLVDVSVGESVRIIRELQELSQNQLSYITKIPQSTISAIENDRISLGVERAKVLARALKCHPAVLVFPGWDVQKESAA